MKYKYSSLKGKCKEYIEKQKCLGCERLSYPNFEGDDNCPIIMWQEEFEKKYRDWRIR